MARRTGPSLVGEVNTWHQMQQGWSEEDRGGWPAIDRKSNSGCPGLFSERAFLLSSIPSTRFCRKGPRPLSGTIGFVGVLGFVARY
jgi:hypothetical protein